MLRVLILALGLLAILVNPFTFAEEPTYKGKTAHEWIAALKDRDPSDAADALWKLGLAAIPPLCDALKNDNPRIRSQAARTLGLFGSKARAALPALRQALEDKDGEVRVSAAETLWEIAGETEKVLPVLRTALTDKEARVRSAAAWALVPLEAAAKPLVPILRQRLKDEDTGVRVNAAFALWRIDRQAKEAVPVLIEALKDTHYEYRINVPGMLDQMRPEAEKAIPVYIELLKDRDPNMRSNVASSLGGYGHKAKAAVPALLLALKDSHAAVRQGAAWGLGRIPSEKKMIGEIESQLRALFKNHDALVRVQAASSVWKLTGNTKETIPILTETFGLTDTIGEKDAKTVKFELIAVTISVRVLADMGPKANEAIPQLRKLLAVVDPQARFHDDIVETIRKIDPKASPVRK